MPIVLPADPARPLEQGDVLAGIETFRSRVGEPPVGKRREFVLVLSRPCNALRDEHVVVAPIEAAQHPDLKVAQTPGELVRVFEKIRDSEGRPDGFYLGALDGGGSARHVARLDELYTIAVPRSAEERGRFLVKHRRFRLDVEYARDLHLRVFRAFASLGFDDVGWWSDEDLDLVVRQGDAWVAAQDREIQALIEDFAARREVLAASGEPGKAENQHKDALAQMRRQRSRLVEQYATQRAEWERRQSRR